MSDIVDRLREFKPFRFEDGEWFGPTVCTEEADEIQSLRQRVERLEVALRIFLGGDDRFQVMVGGNPNAVEKMLEEARALVGSDGHGSHKGEDCYRCSKCDEYEYRIDR